MRPFLASIRLQLLAVTSDFNYVMPLVTAPLTAAIFFAVMDNAGRPDLAGYALFAPALVALWTLALFVSGDIVDVDRALGVLETVIATPASFAGVVLGRVLAVTVVSLLGFVEAWLVARGVFGFTIVAHHPYVLVAAVTATALAMAGTALVMAALFVHSRNARIFQNSLSYPFFVLGGVIAPVALLPVWIQPVSKLVFLSWSADLLRDSLRPEPLDAPVLRVAAVLALGLAGFGFGRFLLGRLVERVRRTGELSLW